MKKFSTILCSLLFVIAGALVIGMKDNRASPTLFPGNMQMYASKPYQFPFEGLPLDVQLDLSKRTKTDTVYIDTGRVVTIYKVKTKIRKVAVPEVVEKHDTLLVPTFYIATPLEHKVESTEIVVVDDVHVIDSTENNHTDTGELE